MNIFVGVLGLCAAVITSVASGWPDEPKTFSEEITKQVEQGKILVDDAEQQLLQHATSAPNEEQGEIFCVLSKLFETKLPASAGRVYDYCRKSLTYSLSRSNQVHVWMRLASLTQLGISRSSELSEAARKEAAFYCLHALKPIERVGRVGSTKTPAVSLYHFIGPPDSPGLKQLQQQHQEEVAAREKADEESALESDRWIVTQELAFLYLHRASDLSELRLLADECSISPDVTAELVRTTRAVAKLGHALPCHDVDRLLQTLGD